MLPIALVCVASAAPAPQTPAAAAGAGAPAPRLIATLPGGVLDAARRGDEVFAALGHDGLWRVDLKTGRSQELARFEGESTSRVVAAAEGVAFMCDRVVDGGDATWHVHAARLIDPADPEQLVAVGAEPHLAGFLSDGRVAVAGGKDDFTRNPGHASLAGRDGVVTEIRIPGAPAGGHAVGDRLYVARTLPGGIAVIDATRGSLLRIIDTEAGATDLRVAGNVAIVVGVRSKPIYSAWMGVVDLQTGACRQEPVEGSWPRLHAGADGRVHALLKDSILRFDRTGRLDGRASLDRLLPPDPNAGYVAAWIDGDDAMLATGDRLYAMRLAWKAPAADLADARPAPSPAAAPVRIIAQLPPPEHPWRGEAKIADAARVGRGVVAALGGAGLWRVDLDSGRSMQVPTPEGEAVVAVSPGGEYALSVVGPGRRPQRRLLDTADPRRNSVLDGDGSCGIAGVLADGRVVLFGEHVAAPDPARRPSAPRSGALLLDPARGTMITLLEGPVLGAQLAGDLLHAVRWMHIEVIDAARGATARSVRATREQGNQAMSFGDVRIAGNVAIVASQELAVVDMASGMYRAVPGRAWPVLHSEPDGRVYAIQGEVLVRFNRSGTLDARAPLGGEARTTGSFVPIWIRDDEAVLAKGQWVMAVPLRWEQVAVEAAKASPLKLQ